MLRCPKCEHEIYLIEENKMKCYSCNYETTNAQEIQNIKDVDMIESDMKVWRHATGLIK